MQGRLSHIRQRGLGDPGWGQTQRWLLEGVSRSVSYYDVPSAERSPNMSNRIRGGVHTMEETLPIDAPTLTRNPRTSQFESIGNAAHFQGYFMTGWSGLTAGFYTPNVPHGALAPSWNPHMAGALELHPATTYDPFPAAATFYPKVV